MSTVPCWASDSHNRRTTVRGPGHGHISSLTFVIEMTSADRRHRRDTQGIECAVNRGRASTSTPSLDVRSVCESHGDGAGAVPSASVAASALDATKVYGSGPTAVTALDGVSIVVTAARMVAVMGPSGSGKSTLLHCMAGLDTLTRGRVTIADYDLGSLSDKALTLLRRERVGFVFQDFNLVPTLTAAENIALPLRLGGRQPDAEWLDEVVTSVGLTDRLRHRPSELSGGQQQRVAVARAVVTRPAIVFADEPTGNLDSRSSGELLALLRRTVDDLGQTIVMVTHDPGAAAHADEVVFLSDGRTVDRMGAPTAARVIDRITSLGG
jgi:putative ABC transport system ATP-binding protein